MKCTFCGSRQHTLTNCPKTFTGQGNRNNMKCGYCGSNTHNTTACPKTSEGSINRTYNPESIQDQYVEDK